MKRIHFTNSYLLNPQHPVTVNIVGAGGTGCRVLSHLAALDKTLRALGHPGLFVSVYDPDTVTEANLGRQLFSETEVGVNKAVCMVSRINNFFGYDWRAVATRFPQHVKDASNDDLANITLTCTDNVKSRLDMWEFLKSVRDIRGNRPYSKSLYWMDFGNTKTTGQVILGTVPVDMEQPVSKKFKAVGNLKPITEYVNYAAVKVRDSGPSCSQAEALEKQDLYINSALAVFGCDILWKMFRHGMIEYRGVFMNLDTLITNHVTV